MHIPKTSGTALVEAISRREGTSRSVYALDRVLFGRFEAFGDLPTALLRTIHRDPSTLPLRARFLAGHLALSSLLRTRRTALMTVLREPRLRLLSHWMFWRNHSENDLAWLGRWGEYVRIARKPLASFLSDPRIACQTDNVATRMLLWPHPLIPPGGFIDPSDDAALLSAALARLEGFGFADLLENPDMGSNLQDWLGYPLAILPRNQARPLVVDRRTSLDREMAGSATDLMATSCRLDTPLWMHVGRRVFGADAAADRRYAALESGLAQCSVLLGGGSSASPAVSRAISEPASH